MHLEVPEGECYVLYVSPQNTSFEVEILFSVDLRRRGLWEKLYDESSTLRMISGPFKKRHRELVPLSLPSAMGWYKEKMATCRPEIGLSQDTFFWLFDLGLQPPEL